ELRRWLDVLLADENPCRLGGPLELRRGQVVAPVAQTPNTLCPLQQVETAAQLILDLLAPADVDSRRNDARDLARFVADGLDHQVNRNQSPVRRAADGIEPQRLAPRGSLHGVPD